MAFMFPTGIENSYPTVRNVQGVRVRVDETAKCCHYDRWRTDFDLVQQIGVDFLRYGPPIHTTWPGPERYWAFADETFAELKRRDLTPIVDLCHFGVPDWIGDFQNPDFPVLFAGYAREFMPPLDEGTILYMPTTLPGITVARARELQGRRTRS